MFQTLQSTRPRMLVAFVAGIIFGIAVTGVYSTTPAQQGLGAWRTNRITGAMTYCGVDHDGSTLTQTVRRVRCAAD